MPVAAKGSSGLCNSPVLKYADLLRQCVTSGLSKETRRAKRSAMSWLIPFLRPLVPVAVDYARARIQTAQQVRVEAPEVSMEPLPLAMRLADAEAQVQSLTTAYNDLGEELGRLNAEANTRIKSARKWGLVLLAWNLALTVAVVVLLVR
jgi:hypothetical protein